MTTRHFIELLAWSRTRQSSEGFDLELHLYELRGRAVVLIPLEQLRTSVTWPDPPLPREIDEGLSFEMTSSGVVRWRLDGSTPKSGEIPPAATR